MESDLMDAECSLHQKPREVCISEDTVSIDLGWLENTKLNRVKNGTRCLCVRDCESLGASPSRIKNGFCETVAEVMDAEVEGEDEMHLSKRLRVSERVPIHVPPEVEPQNRDFKVNEFLRSTPNPVVASVFGDSEILQGQQYAEDIPLGNPGFLNFGDDVHDQSVRERNTDTIQLIPPRLLILAFPSRVWSPILNYATSFRVRESIDREHAAELAILDWVVSCAKYRKLLGTWFSWKIMWALRAGINFPLRDIGALPLCLRIFHTCACSGSRIRGAEEPSRDPSGT